MKKKKADKSDPASLWCFTPAVSLGTFVIEWSLAAYVWENYRKTAFGRATVGLFLILGYFQFAEFAVCRLNNPFFWARSGLGLIAFLPAIFIYLIYLLGHTGKKSVIAGFATAALFFGYFAFGREAVSSTRCLSRFVAFAGDDNYFRLYGLWYWTMVIAAIAYLIKGLQKKTEYHAAAFWLLVSALVLVVPTQIAYWLLPYTRAGHISVFCGFAILTALVMVTKVLPEYHKKII